MGDAGRPQRPSPVNYIRLEAETVRAVRYGSFAEYRVVFNFQKRGSRQMVFLGFPFAVAVAA